MVPFTISGGTDDASLSLYTITKIPGPVLEIIITKTISSFFIYLLTLGRFCINFS